MKIKEMIQIISNEKPQLLSEIPKKQATVLIREVFFQLVKKLDEQSDIDETINVQGLGRFRIRVVEKEKDGQKISEKRFIFRPVKDKSEDSAESAENSQ